MKPEEMRIAIAEACGWHEIHYYGTEGNGPESDVCPPRLVGTRSKCGAGKWGMICSVPKYVDDLNAMHEAEKTLSGYMLGEYQGKLIEVVGPGDGGLHKLFMATAAQRAEAFLKTIGKYKNE